MADSLVEVTTSQWMLLSREAVAWKWKWHKTIQEQSCLTGSGRTQTCSHCQEPAAPHGHLQMWGHFCGDMCKWSKDQEGVRRLMTLKVMVHDGITVSELHPRLWVLLVVFRYNIVISLLSIMNHKKFVSLDVREINEMGWLMSHSRRKKHTQT